MKLVIDNCNDLKMNKFIECLVNDNYNVLNRFYLIHAPKKALENVFNKIYVEYSELIGHGANDSIFDIYKKITLLNLKAVIIEQSLNILSNVYSQQAINVLKKYGYNRKFEWGSEGYEKDLKYINSNYKGIFIEISKLESQLNNLIKESKKTDEKIKYSDFFDSTIMLSKYFGYRINLHEISVTEYCRLVNTYKKSVETLIQHK